MSKPKRTTAKAPDLSYIAEELRQFAVPIDSLEPDPENARAHPDANREATRASLAERGQVLPITVRLANRRVMTGNNTLEEARALGWTHIAAIFRDYTEDQAIAWAIAHNRTAELAQWDYQQLAALVSEHPDVDWGAAGFDAGELEGILAARDGVAEHDMPDTKEIDPDDIEDYEPDQDFFLIKIENVPPAIKDAAVAALNRTLAEIGDGTLVARAY